MTTDKAAQWLGERMRAKNPHYKAQPRQRLAKALFAVLLSLAFTGALSPSAQAVTETTCQSRGSTTVLANRSVRIYESAHGVFYGCRYGKRALRLADSGSDSGPTQFVVRGAQVAFADELCPRDTSEIDGCTTAVKLYDLSARKRVLARGLDNVGGLDGIVISRNNVVGFMIAGIHSSLHSIPTAVYRLDKTALVPLDTGDDIGLGSLAFAEGSGTLYWQRAGLAKSVSLLNP